MAMADALIDGLLDLLLENVDFGGVGDTGGLRGSATAGNFYFQLHSADPGHAGSQSTSEISYTGYLRMPLARSAGNFTRSGNTTSLAATLQFPQCTGGTATATHVSIGTASSGAGTLLWVAAISPNIAISNGVIPELTTGTTFTFA